MTLKIYFGALSIVLFGCTESSSFDNNKPVKNPDSIKLYFVNFVKDKSDSFYLIPSELIGSQEENVEIALQKIANKAPEVAYQYYYNYAVNLIKQHKYHETLKLYNLAEKIVIDKSRYYFNKACAWAYIQPLGNRDSVYFYLNKAVENDSLSAYYFVARSRFLNEDGRYIEAIKNISRAINFAPNDTSNINLRGEFKLNAEDFEGAIKDYKNIASINKDNALFYLGRAIAFHSLKKRKEAFNAADQVIKLDSRVAKAYLIRGNARFMLGDKKKGIEDIRKSAELGDKDALDFIKKYDENH